jgi:hypothetical protein
MTTGAIVLLRNQPVNEISNPGHAGPIPSPGVSVRADSRWARVADPSDALVGYGYYHLLTLAQAEEDLPTD